MRSVLPLNWGLGEEHLKGLVGGLGFQGFEMVTFTDLFITEDRAWSACWLGSGRQPAWQVVAALPSGAVCWHFSQRQQNLSLPHTTFCLFSASKNKKNGMA